MATTSTGRTCTCSIILLSTTLIFIISVVIIGLCVRFLTTGKVQQIILIILICVLGVVGMTSVIILEIRRRRKGKSVKNQRQTNIVNVTNAGYKRAPTAPPLSQPSSWGYTKTNYSNRTTVQA